MGSMKIISIKVVAFVNPLKNKMKSSITEGLVKYSHLQSSVQILGYRETYVNFLLA